jgi:hypothetical protein
MADQKISELTSATSAAGADLLHIVQGGSNKKVTVANFFANIKTPVVINEDGGDQDTRIEGDTDVNLVFVDASADAVGVGTGSPTEKLDVAGNIAVSDGFLRMSQTPTTVTSGSLTVSKAINYINTSAAGGASTNLSLADGEQGQIMHIIMIDDDGDAVLIPLSKNGFSSITFNDIGDSATLLYANSKWNILSAYGVTVA